MIGFFAFGLVGCYSPGTPPGSWHEVYQPLNDPDAETFVFDALAKATAEFGDPAIPVNELILRQSKKRYENRRYPVAEDFSLTSCIDPTNGVFVIYIGPTPADKDYHLLLGHECAHLLNPNIRDWYMEGVASVFGEEICIEKGVKRTSWKSRFRDSRNRGYKLSYQMMFELKQALPEAYASIIKFAVPVDKNPKILRIDIDGWLNSLSETDQQAALDIISKYAKKLKKYATDETLFTVPAALSL